MGFFEKLQKLRHQMNTRQLLGYLAQRFYFEIWLTGQLKPLQQTSERDPFHQIFNRFIERANQLPDYQLLELGSRKVTGNANRDRFHCARYVGFDIHAGENVDVVGDIHQLSDYFAPGTFDAVYSISVFEHLAMPWKAILEINQVMKEGGLLFIGTHPTWPPHELPWDFWRFNPAAFRALLNPMTGFEIVECDQGIPCRVFPLVTEPVLRPMPSHPAYLGVSVVARKIGAPDPRLRWDIATSEVLADMYPTSST